MTVYFDNAATTRVCREAADAAMNAMIENYGNPSSSYKCGRDARDIVAAARKSVASALGAGENEIYFTSGGTEADNWALLCAADLMRHRGRHVITSAAEHEAVLKAAAVLESRGFEVTYLKPDRSGAVPLESVEKNLRDDTILVSLMLVNNETGTVNPIAEISQILRRRSSPALFHTDAVQAFLKMPFSVKSLGVDMAAVSAHKVHAMKGAGAMYIKSSVRLKPFIHGGGQEGGYRSGTEAVPAIASFGAAAEKGKLCLEKTVAHASKINRYIRDQISERLPEAVFIGGGIDSILSFSIPGTKSEVIMNSLDLDGICVSNGSACMRGRKSHVLKSMGLPSDVIDGALRLSFSAENTLEEADYFVDRLCIAAGRFKK